MRPDPDPWALLTASVVAERIGEALGHQFAAAYLHGSAVLGGFDPSVSDLDLLVICREPLTDAEADAVARAVTNIELPARGLEMSVLTLSEALGPDLERPHFQVHVAVDGSGAMRRADGRAGPGDRDLVLHLAVTRASGRALAGPAPSELIAELPDAAVRWAAASEITWALGDGDPLYLVLTAARARALASTGRLVSKVEAAEADAAVPVVRAALERQRGGAEAVDPVEARRYAELVEASLRPGATLVLFRPVGPRELAHIEELGWRAFPPRLHFQPIFYPVLNEAYARQIARDWNATKADTGYRGYVTRFEVDAAYAARFERRIVGGRQHEELWVPAEELDEFNANVIGMIEVVATYQGAADADPHEVPFGTETPR